MYVSAVQLMPVAAHFLWVTATYPKHGKSNWIQMESIKVIQFNFLSDYQNEQFWQKQNFVI